MSLEAQSDRRCALRLENLPVPGGRLFFSAEAGDLVLLQGASASARLRVLGICAGHAFGGPGRCLIQGEDSRTQGVATRRTARVLHFDMLTPGLSLLSATAETAQARGLPGPLALRRATIELELLGLGDCLADAAIDLTPAQQRLALLARAKVCRPAVLVAEDVDEGLDADQRVLMRRALAGAAEQGSCVVLTGCHPSLADIATRHLHIGLEQMQVA